MLSLKYTYPQTLSRLTKGLKDLPDEILDLVLRSIYYDSGENLRSVFPITSTCKHIRNAAYPILLERVVIKANEDIIIKKSWDFLLYLTSRQHLLEYIRHLEIRNAVEVRHLPNEADVWSARMGQSLSRNRFVQCLGLMTRLRSIKFGYVSDMTLELLEQLMPSNDIHVALDLRSPACFVDVKLYQKLERIFARSTGWTLNLSLPRQMAQSHTTDFAGLITSTRVTTIDWCDNSQTLVSLQSQGHQFSDLRELHISSKILDASARLLTPDFIPWTRLKRLNVEGDRQIRILLSTVVRELTDLEDLRLHASTSDAFHDNCLDTSRGLPREPLPYTKLPALKHLSLRGVCPHLHTRYLTTPNLRSLVITLSEYHARLRSFTEARSPKEIKWLADNLPHLTHLELHIGPLENLWNPTAIPGVEVNVEVYNFLQAISHFRNLQFLRLFPPYVPRNAGHDYLNARQPLTDEQAIRVFRHLHEKGSKLHTLSIAATFHALRGFSPMNWLVRGGANSTIILNTRQAGKDYELEQIWIGERRQTMTNRRHTYRKPYLKDYIGGWVFPVEDPLA